MDSIQSNHVRVLASGAGLQPPVTQAQFSTDSLKVIGVSQDGKSQSVDSRTRSGGVLLPR